MAESEASSRGNEKIAISNGFSFYSRFNFFWRLLSQTLAAIASLLERVSVIRRKHVIIFLQCVGSCGGSEWNFSAIYASTGFCLFGSEFSRGSSIEFAHHFN